MIKLILKIFTLILLALLISINGKAQQHSFKVLTISGNVEYRNSTTQFWKRVQPGESLRKKSEIRLDKNSYAALMYNDGRTLEIMEEGIFGFKILENKINDLKISVVQKFANFVAQEIMIDKSQKKDMKTFAAVVRVKPNHIDAAIPAFTSVLDPVINFSWYSYPSTEKYLFSILNSENTSVYMNLVDDTTFLFDAEKFNLNKNIIYKWYVLDAENPKITSDTNFILILPDKKKISVLDTLQLLKNEIETNETPLSAFALGAFYERNHLNIEAANYYNRAVSLLPNSEEYKKLFAKFLLNNKLYIKASSLLENEKPIYKN